MGIFIVLVLQVSMYIISSSMLKSFYSSIYSYIQLSILQLCSFNNFIVAHYYSSGFFQIQYDNKLYFSGIDSNSNWRLRELLFNHLAKVFIALLCSKHELQILRLRVLLPVNCIKIHKNLEHTHKKTSITYKCV